MRGLLAAALLGLALPAGAGPALDYLLQCQGCHLPDGSGAPGRVPDLRDQIGSFLLVPGGRAYLVRVPGSAQSPLSDAALARVLNWMIAEFGPAAVAGSFEPFTAEEVARHRAEPLVQVETLREELLAAIEATGEAR